MNSRPRLLLVTRNFPPLVGGMERLMQKTAEGLTEWADLSIIGPHGCTKFAPDGVRVIEVPSGLSGFLSRGCIAALRLSRQEKFDLVIGGSGLASPILRFLQHWRKVRTALFVHGLDIVVNNAVYQRIFVPCINSADLIIANSENTRRLAIGRGAVSIKVTVINPGTDIPDLRTVLSREIFCQKFGVPFEKLMLFTGRITRRKGLSGFIEKCLPDILQAVPTAGLVVVGDNPEDSLNRQGEAQEVYQLANKLGLAEKIRFLGKVSNEDLLAAYRAADVQVFPLVEVPGDVEGFGMVVIEAAACGTPTVAFDEGGVADAVRCTQQALISSRDYPSFKAAVIHHLTQAPDSGQPIIQQVTRLFSWHAINLEVSEQFSTLISNSPITSSRDKSEIIDRDNRKKQ